MSKKVETALLNLISKITIGEGREMNFMKKYDKSFVGIFIVSLLWIIGRTGANFLLYGMDKNFAIGEWINCFLYGTIDKIFMALAVAALVFHFIIKIRNLISKSE